MTEQEQITFTPEKLMAFKILFERYKNQSMPFLFEGKEFVPGYAKYMIEYLDDQFNRSDTQVINLPIKRTGSSNHASF